MHRSGTSALTRTISLLGADLPRNLMPPVQDNNAAGFWESLDVYYLNDQILDSLDSSWDDWRRLDFARLDDTQKSLYRARADAILTQEFSQSRFFVLKDPRLCRLLTLWIPILASFSAEAKCILPIRNPIEVAASLRRRDGFDTRKSQLLWLRHALEAEHRSRELRRAIVPYDRLLHHPRATIEKITKTLEIAWPRSYEDASPAITAFLQPSLRHHAISDSLLYNAPEIADWIRASYAALMDLHDDPLSTATMRCLDDVRAELDRADQVFGGGLLSQPRRHERTATDSTSRTTELQQTGPPAENQLIDLEKAMAVTEARINAVEDSLASRDATIQVLQTNIQRLLDDQSGLVALKNRLLYQLNGIQMSASWQLGRPLRRLEHQWPSLVRRTAAAATLLWWSMYLKLPRRLELRRQANRLVKTSLFALSWYVDRYPDIVLQGLNPVLHWLVAGWQEGRDPHPLFDTKWYLSQPGYDAGSRMNPLLHYLDVGSIQGCDPHPLFDSSWYLDEHPELRDNGTNPFLHYLAEGAAAGWDPNPLFDTDVYVAASGGECQRTTALQHFAQSGRDFAPGAYLRPEILARMQADYRSKTQMTLLRDHRPIRRPYAVFLQCGQSSVHQRWLSAKKTDWDLIVNHYDSAHVGNIPCEIEFEQTGKLPGTKFTALATIIQRWPEIIAEYEYVMLLDDDIQLNESDVLTLFSTAKKHSLDLTQPTLSRDSYGCHPVFYSTAKPGIRLVSGVEIMMPILSRRALTVGSELFAQTISGWGLDVALATLVRTQLSGRAAVIDDIVAKHSKPIDFSDGAYYRMLNEAHIYPLLEYRCLRRRYRAQSGFCNI